MREGSVLFRFPSRSQSQNTTSLRDSFVTRYATCFFFLSSRVERCSHVKAEYNYVSAIRKVRPLHALKRRNCTVSGGSPRISLGLNPKLGKLKAIVAATFKNSGLIKISIKISVNAKFRPLFARASCESLLRQLSLVDSRALNNFVQ